jgi:hypothetical protein
MTSRRLAVVALFLSGSAFAGEPSVRFTTKFVEVTNLDAAVLAKLKQSPPADWTPLFSVRVATAETPMLGTYRVEDKSLRFEPRFPLAAGLKYRAMFDPSKLPGATGGTPLTVEFALPKPAPKPPATVVQVYPTRNDLPENQLKFYFHFSRPMSLGEAYKRIHLIDAAGKTVERPFLELDEELWDPAGTRLTLFLHPGRIKRGLRPREELGPPLEEGKRYTLVVDATWPDEEGQPLKTGFRKSFTAGKPDDVQPDPKTWKLHAPAAGKADPLRVQFPESLDHALLQRMLWVVDAAGKRVVGSIRVSREETVWEFVPEKPWAVGAYRLVADTELEDLAGNSIASPFEVVEGRPAPKPVDETVEMPFAVR